MPQLFQSSRLLYRALEQSDEPWMLAWGQDSESRFQSTARLPLPAGTAMVADWRKFLDASYMAAVVCLRPDSSFSATPFASNNALQPGLAASAAPTPIGTISFQHPGEHNLVSRNLTVGISLAREHQDKGYGTETLQWALEWAFVHAGMNKVSLIVYGFNDRAVHVYEKIGFVKEGTMREHIWHEGRFWDQHAYGMLERDWRAGRKQGKEGSD